MGDSRRIVGGMVKLFFEYVSQCFWKAVALKERGAVISRFVSALIGFPLSVLIYGPASGDQLKIFFMFWALVTALVHFFFTAPFLIWRDSRERIAGLERRSPRLEFVQDTPSRFVGVNGKGRAEVFNPDTKRSAHFVTVELREIVKLNAISKHDYLPDMDLPKMLKTDPETDAQVAPNGKLQFLLCAVSVTHDGDDNDEDATSQLGVEFAPGMGLPVLAPGKYSATVVCAARNHQPWVGEYVINTISGAFSCALLPEAPNYDGSSPGKPDQRQAR